MNDIGFWHGKKVLITGHTGFKGSWLTMWLLSLGAEVCGYANGIPTDPSLFVMAGLERRIQHRVGDVRDPAALSAALHAFRPDFVFHLAAQAIVSLSYDDPMETITTNVVGTASMLEGLRRVDWPCAAIIITSDKAYDNVEWPWGYRENDRLGGRDIYSGSKGAAELIFTSFFHSFFAKPSVPVRLATVRAGNVIGGGDWSANRIVADCVRAWTKGGCVDIRSPASTRPWQHVLEPLSGYLALAARLSRDADLSGESFNFGPRAEQNATVLELLEELASIWGFSDLKASYRITDHAPFHEASLLKLNCDKALLQLRWEPNLSYTECVGMTGNWYRDVLKNGADAFECSIAQIHNYEDRARQRQRVWNWRMAS